MGGTHEFAILNLIKTDTPMPVTQRQLDEASRDVCLTRVHLDNHLGYCHWAIEDDGKFWVSDEILAKAEIEAQKKMNYWQKRLEWLKSQRQALAARFPAAPVS